MATGNPDFSDYKRIAPPYDEPPRQRGCFFYGCIIAAVLAVLFVIAIVIFAVFLYRLLGGLVDEYTGTAPRPLPTVQMPAESRATLNDRVEAFKAAVKENRPTGPLVLSSDDLNALIEDNPDANLKGKVYVTIEQDKLKGQVSIPLNDIPSFGLTRGRFLNGEAEFSVRLEDGEPYMAIRSLEINGKTPPDEFMRGFKGQNLLKDVQFDPETRKAFYRLDSIYVKDGKLIITAREPSKRPDGEPSVGSDTKRKAGEPPAEKSDAEKKGEDRLPKDVLAPPDTRPSEPARSGEKP
jgi:hypothetical protein